MCPDRKFRLFCFLLFASLASLFSLTLIAAPGAETVSVDPRVWRDVENGGTAHFLILLREQSDSKGAAKLHVDRKTKRRAVTENLRQIASHSQTNLLRMLSQQNVK